MTYPVGTVVRFRPIGHASHKYTVKITSEVQHSFTAANGAEYVLFVGCRVRPSDINVSFGHHHSYTVRKSQVEIIKGDDQVNVVSERRARSTRTVVQVIDNRDGSFDTTDLPWFNHCVDHGSVCSHETRRLAQDFASAPEIWCDGCQRKIKGDDQF